MSAGASGAAPAIGWSASYEPMPGMLRWLGIGVLSVMVVGGSVSLVGSVVAGAEVAVLVFLVVWLIGVCTMAWFFLTRVVMVLRLSDHGVEWRAIAARGFVRWEDITQIELRSNFLALGQRHGPMVRVLAAKGVSALVDELRRRGPTHEVRLSAYVRLVERQSGPSAWRVDP